MRRLITDINSTRRLWWIWPLVTAGYIGLHYILLSATVASLFLIVVIATAVSGRWAGWATAAVVAAFAAYLYGDTDPARVIEVTLALLLIPSLIVWLRDLTRQSQARVEELNGNLIRLRGALEGLDSVLKNNSLSHETIGQLLQVRGRIADLLTVAGLWIELSRQERELIERGERGE